MLQPGEPQLTQPFMVAPGAFPDQLGQLSAPQPQAGNILELGSPWGFTGAGLGSADGISCASALLSSALAVAVVK